MDGNLDEPVSAAGGDRVLLRLRAPDYGVDLSLRRGGHLHLSGPRASGKTTLARALAGRRRRRGITVDYTGLGAGEVALVTFSEPVRSVEPQFYQQRYNASATEGHARVSDFIGGVGEGGGAREQNLLDGLGVTPLLPLERSKLSSGQHRRVLLARALLQRPRILVVDNPYVGLDAPGRRTLNALLDQLAAAGEVTLVLAGHGGALPACVRERVELPAPPGPPLPPAPGERLRAAFAATPAPAQRTVIDCGPLRIRYGERTVLDLPGWTVRPGEKWSIYGPNGSGKSTLLSLLYGDNPQAYAQPIRLFDRRRGAGESIWSVKARTGFTSPELHHHFPGGMSAEDAILTGLSDTFVYARRPTVAQRERAFELLAYFGLLPLRPRPFASLSTGTQRLLLFLRALVKAPPVLLLDEPFQTLDAPTVARCRTLLDDLLGPAHTLIFVTHFRAEIPACVDRKLRL